MPEAHSHASCSGLALADLYGVTTERFNEQVRRNLKRFPVDFMLQFTDTEMTPEQQLLFKIPICDLEATASPRVPAET